MELLDHRLWKGAPRYLMSNEENDLLRENAGSIGRKLDMEVHIKTEDIENDPKQKIVELSGRGDHFTLILFAVTQQMSVIEKLREAQAPDDVIKDVIDKMRETAVKFSRFEPSLPD